MNRKLRPWVRRAVLTMDALAVSTLLILMGTVADKVAVLVAMVVYVMLMIIPTLMSVDDKLLFGRD